MTNDAHDEGRSGDADHGSQDLQDYKADGTVDGSEEEIRDEYDLSLLREDLGRQLSIMSDRQNAMIVSIGILVAFASVLFTQQALMSDLSNFVNFGSLITVLLCAGIGIFTIFNSCDFMMTTGMNAKTAITLYNEGKTGHYEEEMVNGIYRSYLDAYWDNSSLAKSIRWMASILILGIIMQLLGLII